MFRKQDGSFSRSGTYGVDVWIKTIVECGCKNCRSHLDQNEKWPDAKAMFSSLMKPSADWITIWAPSPLFQNPETSDSELFGKDWNFGRWRSDCVSWQPIMQRLMLNAGVV